MLADAREVSAVKGRSAKGSCLAERPFFVIVEYLASRINSSPGAIHASDACAQRWQRDENARRHKQRRKRLTHFLHDIYNAAWLWLPLLVLFLVQGLHCSPPLKLMLFKISLYYIVSEIGLQLLVPTAHLALRTMLFDLTTRVFLFIQAAEILWSSWHAAPALASGGGVLKQQKLIEDDEDDDILPINTLPGRSRRRWLTPHYKLLLMCAVSASLYLGWTLLGLAFAFTLTPGM